MLKVYIVERTDNFDYDECIEQTIVASTEERAIELANKQYGTWKIKRTVDLNKEQVLTTKWLNG